VTITPADVLTMAIVVAIQAFHYEAACPYPTDLFVDVLAKVGYVKNATSIVQVRIRQVFPEAFEYRQRDLSFVHVHDRLHCEQRSDDGMVFS
jgi:hypothetical protein